MFTLAEGCEHGRRQQLGVGGRDDVLSQGVDQIGVLDDWLAVVTQESLEQLETFLRGYGLSGII